MPLWGSNTTNANDKPLYLNANGTYYAANSAEGVTAADAVSSDGVLIAGWTYIHASVGGVSGVSITAGGTGYANGASLTFLDASGAAANGAAATISTNSTGGIVSVTLTAAGSGYDANTTASAPTGTGATFAVSTTARVRYEPLVAASSFT